MLALSGQILYHDTVPVIVSRFTSLIEDFVITRFQVTKLFCSRYCFTSAFPARRTCHVASQADFAISVFREVRINYVLP